MKHVHFNVICVGAGGTGGNFAKEFARYMAYLSKDKTVVSFALVDGDLVEESNRSRQPYCTDDLSRNKAVTLVDAIQDVFDVDNVSAYPIYLENEEDLDVICKQQSFDGFYKDENDHYYMTREMIILIGCVDNHRARQVMDSYFYNTPNIIYIDSANEFSVGEICIGARINKKNVAPPRSWYFPDVLTDKSPSASEMSCGAVNLSSPQHIATNLMAAHLLLGITTNIISNGKLDCGIVYFDSFKYFSRFDKYEEPKVDESLLKRGEDG